MMNGTPREPLEIRYHVEHDIVEINGQGYSGDLFRQFAKDGLVTGTLFEFERKKDGTFNIRKVSEPS